MESQRRRIAQPAAMLESDRDDLAKTDGRRRPWTASSPACTKEEGEVVIGAQSFQPTVIMTVADLSVMEVEVLVDETDIRNVTLGQEAEVRVDALEGLKIKGEVTEIGSSAIAARRGTAGIADRQHRQPGQGLQGGGDAQGPAAHPAPRPQRHRRHHHRRARPSVLASRSRRWWCARSTSDGQGGRPRAPCRPPSDEPDATPVQPQKGEEKEGVFVVDERPGRRSSPSRPASWARPSIEVVEGLSRGRRDRDRLLQDAAHAQGRGADQGRAEEGAS